MPLNSETKVTLSTGKTEMNNSLKNAETMIKNAKKNFLNENIEANKSNPQTLLEAATTKSKRNLQTSALFQVARSLPTNRLWRTVLTVFSPPLLACW